MLHDPDCLRKFDEHLVVIVPEVLGELDEKKTVIGEVGANARRIHRVLWDLLNATPGAADLPRPVNSEGGMLRFFTPSLRGAKGTLTGRLFPPDSPDNRILRAAAEFERDHRDFHVVIVSKDLNLCLKAAAAQLTAQDYFNDAVPSTSTTAPPIPEVVLPLADYVSLKKGGQVVLSEALPLAHHAPLRVRAENCDRPASAVLCRHLGEGLIRPVTAPDCLRVAGGNPLYITDEDQRLFTELLLDPKVSLITCQGKAGTGKTLVAIAAALSQSMGPGARYDHVLISRPVISMGKEMGYLPGGLLEKYSPFLRGFHDALNFIMTPQREAPPVDGPLPSFRKQKRQMERVPLTPLGAGGDGAGAPPPRPSDRLIASGVVEIQALSYIRGASLANSILILDEAQLTTPHEIKTLITRCSVGSKIILIGDVEQIDSPYLNDKSNGLAYVRARMNRNAICAHTTLTKCRRSPLADLAANLL